MYIGSIDQGTTSSRFIIFNKGGEIISMGQKEHEQIYPQAGWVEHNAEEIWQNVQEVIGLALGKAGLSARDIAAVGITNQRETTVVWNKNTGKPYHNALVWQDTRVGSELAELAKDGGMDRFRAKTGLPLATYFSGLKLRWLLNHVPDLREDAMKGDALFGTMDTYISWQLTGGTEGGIHITDVTNASRTQLMDLATCAWDDEILQVLNIPKAMLPEIKASSQVYANSKGVLEGVPLAGILGDQQAALVGQTCFDPGQGKNTYGTGCFLLMNTGQQAIPSQFGLLTTVAYQLGNEPVHYALEGSVAIAGSLVQWLRDNLGLIQNSPDIENLAKEVEDNGGCYFVPAFSGLYAPYWKQDARGVLVGLTSYVNKSHIARAALEATAFQTWEVLEAMEKDAGISISSLRVDGGMVVNELLMQFQSDILGQEVICPKIIETTALGAAYAAGLAVGYWENLEDLKKNWAIQHRWNSQMEDSQRSHMKKQWKKAVSKSFNWED
ncbi:glycerol kinase GlpK [Aquirufa ecclesiirivi]|uniref:Glycerol kinase n=1 Tax=Aquirufa ecclesiirivi TaxID=2715124 RepID=A0ABT4JHD5_9BACT|nr:glycerol kinase GlpK [Aquirufa ecclesiirivi]MCZ2473651.1 glycerol kinase GlpK [Aquirufa ecclesiirivi]MCZ2475686.1 glycerol kinase GlpK [Aquirufa ecclesiirivi]NHC48996.1 glycerol kinase GlpK [Aquirufa ecclesiirivi]